jgi:hypothetical protein
MQNSTLNAIQFGNAQSFNSMKVSTLTNHSITDPMGLRRCGERVANTPTRSPKRGGVTLLLNPAGTTLPYQDTATKGAIIYRLKYSRGKRRPATHDCKLPVHPENHPVHGNEDEHDLMMMQYWRSDENETSAECTA